MNDSYNFLPLFSTFRSLSISALCFAANRFLNDKSASEDIVQEAFARLWELVSKEKEIESIDNYMYMSGSSAISSIWRIY